LKKKKKANGTRIVRPKGSEKKGIQPTGPESIKDKVLIGPKEQADKWKALYYLINK